MSLAERVLERQRTFEATGDFTSRDPVPVAELDADIFTEAQAANIGSSAYRSIGVENLKTPTLTKFRRVTGAHSAAAARGTDIRVYREEPLLRAGIIGTLHWTLEGTAKKVPDTRILGPHIDDYFTVPALCYFGVFGQPMLHYPGNYTLDLGRLRKEGHFIDEETFRLWQERDSYRNFAYEARDQLTAVYTTQIALQGIKPVEAPCGLIMVTDDHFLHSEGDHSQVVGEYRGLVRRFAPLFD